MKKQTKEGILAGLFILSIILIAGWMDGQDYSYCQKQTKVSVQSCLHAHNLD